MLVQGTLTDIPRVSFQPSSTSLETSTVVSLETYPKEQIHSYTETPGVFNLNKRRLQGELRASASG